MERGVGVGSNAAAAVSPPAADIAIYLCRDPVDFREGINGLSVLVESAFQCDPFSRNLFCCVNKRRNQIKVLYWQRTGFCLWLKRPEEERFKWRFHLEGPVGCSSNIKSRWEPNYVNSKRPSDFLPVTA